MNVLVGAYCLARERTLCKLGWHCRRSKRVRKFNGGNGAWVCCYCNLIIKYGHDN